MGELHMRKIAAILLVLTLFNLCLGFALGENPASTPEPEHHTCGDYEYIILEDGTAEITGYTLAEEYLLIPEELDGYQVTGIGEMAFFRNKSLVSVTIPDSVVYIGERTFAFCPSLKWVIIPDSVTAIGNSAFAQCPSLVSVTIPEGVSAVGQSAFLYCSSLASVTIPDSVSTIGTNPFMWCENLTDIIVSDNHPYLAVTDGLLISLADERLVCCPYTFAGDSCQVPSGIRIIGDWAFYRVPSLVSVTIPDSVTDIGTMAFDGCDSLTLTVTRGSYAEQYCKENDVAYAYADSLN